jgi:cation diffusion facilitator CzcD-associated flavoprotein CzcO
VMLQGKGVGGVLLLLGYGLGMWTGLGWLWGSVLIMVFLAVGFYLFWKDADPKTQTPDMYPAHVPLDETKDVPNNEKIAIVGGGFCGLGIGAAFKRYGIPFDILEATDEIGGNWYHGVYGTVHIISSRKTTEYKDWPMPSDWPDFPSAQQVLGYLRSYADHYRLRPHIQLNTEVKHVRPIGKGKHSEGWEVEINDGIKRVYKGVVVANGHHWSKRWPNYPGMHEFEGETLHSKDYKDPSQLQGKRVLVVGGGNSACDIAVEAARYGEASHCSHRRGYWFLPRSVMGRPLVDIIKPWMPMFVQRLVLRFVLWVSVGPNEQYGLQKPDHDIFEHHPTINSELLHFIKLGRISPHPDIAKIDGKTVHFVNNTQIEVDMIIYATGYNIALPMLDREVVPYKNGVPQLVGGLLVEGYKNLYVFGIGQVRYGAGPLITAAADGLARMIQIQEKLTNPLSDVMTKLPGGREKPQKCEKSADVLVDPHLVYLRVKRLNWLLPKLPTLEQWLTRLHLL